MFAKTWFSNSKFIVHVLVFALPAVAAAAQETVWTSENCKISAPASLGNGQLLAARNFLECQEACLQSSLNLNDPNRCTGYTFISTSVSEQNGFIDLKNGIPACMLFHGPIVMGSGSPIVQETAKFFSGTIVDAKPWDETRADNSLEKECWMLSTPEFHIFRRPIPMAVPTGVDLNTPVVLSPALEEAIGKEISATIANALDRELGRALAEALRGVAPEQ